MGRSIIFDLDGTLADTSGDLIAAANACFDGMPLDPIADQRTAFRGGRAMLRLALDRVGPGASEEEVDRLFPIFLGHYDAHIDVKTVLYPGVVEVLDNLSTSGWRLGVCTNKPIDLARKLLDRLDLARWFGAVLGADSLAVRKPHPQHLLATIAQVGSSADRSLLIGDTQTDRDAARNAGVPCVLVGFGPDGEDVRALNPAAVLSDYRDLPALADRLVPPA